MFYSCFERDDGAHCFSRIFFEKEQLLPPNEFFTETVFPPQMNIGLHVSGPGSVSKECKRETTPWSACSVSCGMGVSMRVTNDNEDCQPVQQRRLCLVRPCELNDKHLVSMG